MKNAKLHKALDAMIKGKSFRINTKSKAFFGKIRDQWFTIGAIESDGRLTMCGTYHTMLRGISIEDIINL